MGFFDGYDIATSGMSAQRTRINVVSANMANAKTTHSADGGPYKKQNVVFEELLLKQTQSNTNPSNDLSSKQNDLALRGVGVKSVIDSQAEPVMKYEPEHPDANEEGYVAYPNINPVIEMVDLIEAMRSYEANLTSFQTHKTIDTKTIEILKGQ